MLYFVMECISALLPELAMFCLAALVGLLMTFSTPVSPKQSVLGCKKTSTDPSSSEDEAKQKPWGQGVPKLPSIYLPVMQAAKSGDAAGAVYALSALPENAQADFPADAGAKVLLALAKTSNIPDGLMHQFIDISNIFNLRAFEKAAVISSWWSNTKTSQQLFQLARLASVRRSLKLTSNLLQGLIHDADATLAFIKEITAPGSGVYFTASENSKQAAIRLAKQCSEAGHTECAELILKRSERVRSKLAREKEPKNKEQHQEDTASLQRLLIPHLEQLKEKCAGLEQTPEMWLQPTGSSEVISDGWQEEDEWSKEGATAMEAEEEPHHDDDTASLQRLLLPHLKQLKEKCSGLEQTPEMWLQPRRSA